MLISIMTFDFHDQRFQMGQWVRGRAGRGPENREKNEVSPGSERLYSGILEKKNLDVIRMPGTRQPASWDPCCFLSFRSYFFAF
jgi:hypothetical protein